MKRTFYALCCVSIFFISCNGQKAEVSAASGDVSFEAPGIQDVSDDVISSYGDAVEDIEDGNFDGAADVSKKFVVPVYYSKGIPKN